jgi:hypothetical protein
MEVSTSYRSKSAYELIAYCFLYHLTSRFCYSYYMLTSEKRENVPLLVRSPWLDDLFLSLLTQTIASPL